ncbi:MAG: tRNA (adenosine(37)-N6)-dimethylallyltransferase MiaA [Deltaproteobacteria bacterium]|nr:tRNA (adenosine(37)-N6)-dimethylallyltransferase MiaA [Deltaproteobacteria bacterium]
MSRPRLVVVAGATASGKSALALELAERARGDVLVVDSRQVYRGMDIGTAKATEAERQRVPHHGIDLVDPADRFDAAMFREHAVRGIEDTHRRGIPLVVEGGTGLWLRTLLMGLMEAPSRDDAVRAELREEASRLGWPALHARLAEVDPDYAARIQPNDPVRITRALEVHTLTGRPFSDFERGHAFRERPYDVKGVFLEIGLAEHRARITARVEAMWRGGLLEETRRLLSLLPGDHPILGTINYAQAREQLRGVMDERDAKATAVTRTAQFAKRQRTWFRREPWAEPITADAQAAFLQDALRYLGR